MERRRNVYYVLRLPNDRLVTWPRGALFRQEVRLESRGQATWYRDAFWPAATVERVEQGQ